MWVKLINYNVKSFSTFRNENISKSEQHLKETINNEITKNCYLEEFKSFKLLQDHLNNNYVDDFEILEK